LQNKSSQKRGWWSGGSSSKNHLCSKHEALSSATVPLHHREKKERSRKKKKQTHYFIHLRCHWARLSSKTPIKSRNTKSFSSLHECGKTVHKMLADRCRGNGNISIPFDP
jgi:hypothetical protein